MGTERKQETPGTNPAGHSATLTVDECASYLRIGRGHCYSMIRQGIIPSVRLGKRLLVPRKGLDRLLEGTGQSKPTNR